MGDCGAKGTYKIAKNFVSFCLQPFVLWENFDFLFLEILY